MAEAKVFVKAKNALTSKLNWLGILTALAGIADIADIVQLPDWAIVVSGVATVLLRTLGTTQPVVVGQPKAVAVPAPDLDTPRTA